MYTVIITAYDEPNTIEKALSFIADPQKSGYDGVLNIIQVSPDSKTLDNAKNYIKKLGNKNIGFLQLVDDKLGKPHALNQAFKRVNTSKVIMTDGDVFFEKNSLGNLISFFEKNNFDAICGQPVSLNNKGNFWGYISHMMVSAANHKRKIILSKENSGIGTKFVTKQEFFPLTGYMMMFDKEVLEDALGEKFVFPGDCLVDDAYISYVMFNKGLKLGYVPDAKVNVKFPTNLSDFFKQKKRSTGGYIQLWKYGVVTKKTKARSFWHDLEYFWFPLKFAKNIKEIIYSFFYYPVRFFLWVQIFFERKYLNKSFQKTWQRVDSTK